MKYKVRVELCPLWGKANREIHNAVITGNAGGYGYADLAALSRNAILQYRDMYLRPDYYEEKENEVRALIADLIIEVENGADYETAKKPIQEFIDPQILPTIPKLTRRATSAIGIFSPLIV